jgi:phage terminase large subunit-like protein
MSFDPKAAKLRPGERAFVLCLAVDRDQAAIQFKYISALFDEIPTLKALVRNTGSDSIELRNRVVIQVTTNSYRSIRGRSVLAAIFDEVAFYRSDESANPDTELHAAITPGLARMRGSMLILISSAHKRSGLLYDRWKSFYGKNDDDVLVVRGTTTQFNPTFDRSIIDKALVLDPQRYGAEFESLWRDDLAQFLP